MVEHLLTEGDRTGAPAAAPGIRGGVITGFRSNGDIIVDDADCDTRYTCKLLITGAEPPQLHINMPVLVWVPAPDAREGVVLGRVGAYEPAAPSTAPAKDHVTIEANESLSLKCGNSSIDLRKDGKLMVRGNDVLTRAKRTNRIKGGSVGIN